MIKPFRVEYGWSTGMNVDYMNFISMRGPQAHRYLNMILHNLQNVSRILTSLIWHLISSLAMSHIFYNINCQ